MQGQRMKRKGADGVSDYDDAFCPVPAPSGFHTILSLATKINMFTDYVDISQNFVQGELLPEDSQIGNVYISFPLGYEEDSRNMCHLLKSLYGMPSAARAWHTRRYALFWKEKAGNLGVRTEYVVSRH